MALSTRV